MEKLSATKMVNTLSIVMTKSDTSDGHWSRWTAKWQSQRLNLGLLGTSL